MNQIDAMRMFREFVHMSLDDQMITLTRWMLNDQAVPQTGSRRVRPDQGRERGIRIIVRDLSPEDVHRGEPSVRGAPGQGRRIVVTDKFADWPENLPREDLVRLLRSYADECRLVTQVIARAFPDRYPLGDGEVIPTDQRVVIDEDALIMAKRAVFEIEDQRDELNRLRSELDRISGGWEHRVRLRRELETQLKDALNLVSHRPNAYLTDADFDKFDGA